MNASRGRLLGDDHDVVAPVLTDVGSDQAKRRQCQIADQAEPLWPSKPPIFVLLPAEAETPCDMSRAAASISEAASSLALAPDSDSGATSSPLAVLPRPVALRPAGHFQTMRSTACHSSPYRRPLRRPRRFLRLASSTLVSSSIFSLLLLLFGANVPLRHVMHRRRCALLQRCAASPG